MTTGDKIKAARIKKGLTQKQLGELCGMADSAIRRYELGRANPKLDTINRIAEALGVTTYSLSNFSDFGLEEHLASFNMQNPLSSPSSTDKEIIGEFIDMGEEPKSIPQYFDSNEYTPGELEEIKKYAEFIKSKRNTESDKE